MKHKIAVLEPGAFGTALGILLSVKHEIAFWYQNRALASQITKSRINSRLPNTPIPEEILISSNLKEVLLGSSLAIIAVPSFALRQVLKRLKAHKNIPPLLGVAKGLENDSCLMPSQIVEQHLGKIPYAHFSGPGFARRIAQGRAAKEVLASKNLALLKRAQEIFSSIRNMRIEITQDLLGVQLAGALKNVIAIGMGIADFGIKNKSARKKLLAAGLKEMMRLGQALGAKKETFQGPAGLGDLLLTSSAESRNYQLGRKIFSKDFLTMKKEIRQKRFTSEGFFSARAAFLLGKKQNLRLPFINEIYSVLFENKAPEDAYKSLRKLAGE